MSRKRVIYGEDDRGRPLSRWEGPDELEPVYGHMEPAYDSVIERRKASPDELTDDARPAPWQEPGLIVARHAAPLHAQRPNGATRAAQAQEERPVSDHAHRELTPLEQLAEAAQDAALAEVGKRAADEAWEIARTALAAAYAAVEGIVEPAAPIRPDRAAMRAMYPTGQLQNVDDPVVVTYAPEPGPDPVQPPAAPPSTEDRMAKSRRNGQASMRRVVDDRKDEKAARLARVMEAMDRLGGDQRAVAAELGMRPNAVAMVVKHAPKATAVSA